MNRNSAAERHRRDDATLDRSVGAFLGLAVGDALGAAAEGMARGSYTRITDFGASALHGLAPGEWTDDTAMALCLADSLLACGELDRHDLMQRFVRWYRTGDNACRGRMAGIGVNTRAALETYERTGAFAAASERARGSGNGCIMRLAPVAIRYRTDAREAHEAALLQARTTHCAEEAAEAAGLMVDVMVLALRVGDLDATPPAAPRPREPRIQAIADGEYRPFPRERISSAARAADTLEAALWCLHRADPFEEAVVEAVNLGGDTDTIGATTGQLAGAVFGARAIPSRWLHSLHAAGRIAALATALHHAAGADTGMDRPSEASACSAPAKERR